MTIKGLKFHIKKWFYKASRIGQQKILVRSPAFLNYLYINKIKFPVHRIVWRHIRAVAYVIHHENSRY